MVPLEGKGCVGAVIIVVFQINSYVRMIGEILAVVGVGGVGRLRQLQKPVRMVVHPVAVDSGVVGYHVAGQPDTPAVTAFGQSVQGFPAAQLIGDLVTLQRIGGGFSFRISAGPLYRLGGVTALPQTDQPEGVKTHIGQPVQLFVRDLIEPVDASSVGPGELIEPYQGALCNQHDSRHPVGVLAEGLIIELQTAVVGGAGRSRARRKGRALLFLQIVDASQQPLCIRA